MNFCKPEHILIGKAWSRANRYYKSFTLILLLLAASVCAEDEPTYDRLRFEVTSQTMLVNDQLNIRMYAKSEAFAANKVANSINQKMHDALRLARKYPAVKIKTGNYYINPVYDKHDKIVRWTGRQVLNLESTDIKSISELMKNLQDTLNVETAIFVISDKARKEVEDSLIKEAVVNLKRRSELLINELGGIDYKIVSLRINTPEASVRRPISYGYKKSRISREKMTAPAFAAGTDKLQVYINAEIEVQY